LTVRQLLRHQSGLPNPESTAPKDGAPTAFHMPGYNVSRDPVNGYCAGPVTGKPGGNWAYNNCDYIVAGALLEAVTGQPWRKLVQSRIAKPLGLRSLGAFPAKAKTRPGFDQGKPEPAYDLASFGAAGALYGSAADLLKFDQALMSGTLLGPAQLKELWDGQENLGYIALGQWAFTVPLKGCADPVRIVERRGAIGGVQVRNFILPEKQIAVVAFTDRGEFDFGEIWQASGFSHDLLALAACGTGGT
jgi:CubicO group peptidase (beta-lactamase class C family)